MSGCEVVVLHRIGFDWTEMQADNKWQAGAAPVAVIMISLNEAHNMEAVLCNLKGWAQEVFLVDSCSADETVDIALRHGVHVVQHKFKGFGDQWNFALQNLPITAPWTMKLDPDERLSDDLKEEILELCRKGSAPFKAFSIPIRLHFIRKRLPSVLRLTRLWKTGSIQFSNVKANEHVLVDGGIGQLHSEIEHWDSPNLDHWVTKQNRYTTAEAISQYEGQTFSVQPRFWGDALQRRMWFKRHFWKFPGRYVLLFLYHLLVVGAWRAGKVGWIWSHLRTEVYRQWEYKRYEIEATGRLPVRIPTQAGAPDARVPFYD